MNKLQLLFLVAICIVFSFLGGLLSGKFYEKFTYNNLANSNTKINTELPTKLEHIIKANEFQLVDKDGKVYAFIGIQQYIQKHNHARIEIVNQSLWQ